MTAQATQNLPFTKFTRAGFGFSSKSRMRTKPAESDEDWYIPYNGPYEAPRELPNRRRARDSWGDPLEPDDEDMVLNDRELRLRYGDHNSLDHGDRSLEEERIGRRRGRTVSVTSPQTVSSAVIDPSRPSIAVTRRSTVSTGTRQNLPSFISMDTVGGVGESPIPLCRSSPERNRTRLTSFFSFTAHPRKLSNASSVERITSGSFVHKPLLPQRSNVGTGYGNEKFYDKTDAPARCSSSLENPNLPVKGKHQRLLHQVLHTDRPSSDTTEADYHDSYYSTLAHDPRSESALNHRQRHHLSPSLSKDVPHSHQPPFDQSNRDLQDSSSPKSNHPYARAIPRSDIEKSSKIPLIFRRPAFTMSSHNPNGTGPPNFTLTRLASPRKKLRNSSSTPDLRSSVIFHDTVVTPATPIANLTRQQNPTPHHAVPKVKDRWLSAETWCDAVLFPRPRLKVGIVATLGGGGSGRIISPDSPIEPDSNGLTGVREPGVASRVLAHSLSLVDLKRPVGLSSSYIYPRGSHTSRAGQQSTTFAQDDSAAPSTPVPSLAHVLEQGQQLADERKAWQSHAQKSFGNKQARNLGRARSKSLVQNGRRREHQVQTSIDYLAAQACLGDQSINPILSATDLNTTNASSSRRGSHSQNNSLDKTRKKSSNISHSRTHSRADSWSKSAVKVAKSSVVICGFSQSEDEVVVLREGDVRAASLEGALRGDKTRVIRLADPVHIPIDRGLPIDLSLNSSPRVTPSPPPLSNSSHQGVGIALGTPPLEDDQSDLSYYPSHPYAQGGLSFSSRGANFAGPHPSIKSDVDTSQISDTLARHKLPPHFHLHPYAQGSTRDSYLDQSGLVAQYRSETPRQTKMWAQLSPGVLREVLPDDFQYSPYTPRKETSPAANSSESLQIIDTIGVGETLVNAACFGANGVGTEDADNDATPISQVDGDKDLHIALPEFGSRTRTIRQPIEYSSALSKDLDILPKPPATQVASLDTPQLLSDNAVSNSSASSTSSSPPLTPCRLGSLNDLDNFQDLFYRPNNDLQRSHNEAALPDTPSPPYISTNAWSNKVQRPKTESSLTSLARQLSQEFDLITREQVKSSSSQHSSLSPRQQSRRPTAGSLEFVFEEASQLGAEVHSHAFQPSDSLPEDVESSRASSLMERADAEDDTAMLRLGVVESILTPSSALPVHRPNSCAGETSTSEGRQQDQPPSSHTLGVPSEARTRIFSGLHLPDSEPRSSYTTTTSTASRMSGLSDFPVPPKEHHLSLGSYFNQSMGEFLPPPPSPDQRLFFGRNENAGDLAKTLSSSS